MNGTRKPGLDACIGIARALNVPIDTVVRKARPSELPFVTEDQAMERELLYKIKSLDESGRLKVMEYIKWAEYQADLAKRTEFPTAPSAARRSEGDA